MKGHSWEDLKTGTGTVSCYWSKLLKIRWFCWKKSEHSRSILLPLTPFCARARYVFSPYFLHRQIVSFAQIVAGRKCIGYDFHIEKVQDMDFSLRDGSFPWWMELRFRLRGCWPPARCAESATFDPFDFCPSIWIDISWSPIEASMATATGIASFAIQNIQVCWLFVAVQVSRVNLSLLLVGVVVC